MDAKKVGLLIPYFPRNPEIRNTGDIVYVRVDELAFTDTEMVLKN